MHSPSAAFSPVVYPWVPDSNDGLYHNPILHADYSDPDVIRVGEDFYMVASSFQCTPGLPVLHSKDLVNWRLLNHAVHNLPHDRYRAVQPGCGVWAPAIRFHDGKFWIFFPMPDEGIYVTTATDPAGEWCEPWCLQEAKGWIDPCPFWDDDGKAYLLHAFAFSRAGKKERIHCRPMSPDGKRLLGEGMELFHTPHHLYLEGPKIHKLNGWYYILAPGGGVQTGWQVVFRSKSLEGPYEEKTVLEQGSTPINGPHQGALIDLPNGEWWFIHFQDVGAFGRIVHLQPVRWEEGWPLMGIDHDGNGIGEPVESFRRPAVSVSRTICTPATTDEFDGTQLGLQWQWHANHEPDWALLSARPGWLRLISRPLEGDDFGRAPHFLGQKFPARCFKIETLLDFAGGSEGERAGLVVLGGGTGAALMLRRVSEKYELLFHCGVDSEKVTETHTAQVRLSVSVDEAGLCSFSYSQTDDIWVPIERKFTASAGGWIGAKVGLLSVAASDASARGWAEFDYFRFGA